MNNEFEPDEKFDDKFNPTENQNPFQEYEEDRLCHEAMEIEEYEKNVKRVDEMMTFFYMDIPGFCETERIKVYLEEAKLKYKLSELFYKINREDINCYYPYTLSDGTIMMGVIDKKSIRNTAVNIDLDSKIFLPLSLRDTLKDTPIHGLQNRLTLTADQIRIRTSDKHKFLEIMKPVKPQVLVRPAKRDQHEIYVLRHALKHTVNLLTEIVNLRPDIFKIYKAKYPTKPYPLKGTIDLNFNQCWLTEPLEKSVDKIFDSSKTNRIISDALKSF